MRCANRNYIQLVFSSVQESHFLLTNTIPIIFLMKCQETQREVRVRVRVGAGLGTDPRTGRKVW